MLAQKTYPTERIERCRTAIAERTAAYRDTTAGLDSAARAGFERLACRDLIVLLDAWFVHRTRGVEGKDGNPANEVRMLSASITDSDGVLAADSTIKYRAGGSVCGVAVGDPIDLTLDQVERLADAYLATIATRFAE